MKVKYKVERMLEAQPRTRSSDKELLLAYWERQGFVLTPGQRTTFLNLTTPAETITRARRLLRAEYPGSVEVEKERRVKQSKMTQERGNV